MLTQAARFRAIADVLRDFARFERTPRPYRQNPQRQRPCEACGSMTYMGGLCPDCIELAAGACQWRAK